MHHPTEAAGVFRLSLQGTKQTASSEEHCSEKAATETEEWHQALPVPSKQDNAEFSFCIGRKKKTAAIYIEDCSMFSSVFYGIWSYI